MNPEEIREALASEQFILYTQADAQTNFVGKAARAYADLLENGQEMEATRVGHKWGSALLKPGRYLVVPVEDDA